MDRSQTTKILAPSWDIRLLSRTNLLERITSQSMAILSIGAQLRASALPKVFWRQRYIEWLAELIWQLQLELP